MLKLVDTEASSCLDQFDCMRCIAYFQAWTSMNKFAIHNFLNWIREILLTVVDVH